jgi:hypothetical protein
MPTGYTCVVEDGTVTDFRTFALRCARAFGPCAMQREDDMANPPEIPKPSTHHLDRLREARAELKRLENMDGETLHSEMEAEYAKRAKEAEESRQRVAAESERYAAMIAQVEAWTPPTKDHEPLKAFMLSQLRESIHTYTIDDPKRVTAEKWLALKIESEQRSIDYHTKERAEELRRHEKAGEWIKALYAAL